MTEKELDRIALDFAIKYTPGSSVYPTGPYSINRSDLKFGFKEGVKFILKQQKKEQVEKHDIYCEGQY